MLRRRHKGLKILHPRVPDRKQHPGDSARYRHELHPQAVLIRGIQGRIHFLLRHAGRGFRRRWLRRGFGGQGCRHSGGQIHFALGLGRQARTFASEIPARHPQHQQQRQGGHHRIAAAGPRRCGFSREGFDERHTATETLRLLFRQTAGKDRPNRVGHPFRRLGWLADSRLAQRQLVLGLKRQVPGQQLVGHHRQGILVGGPVLALAAPLLGGHVGAGAAGAEMGLADPRQTGLNLCGEAEIQSQGHLPQQRNGLRQAQFPALLLTPAAQIDSLRQFQDQVVIPRMSVLLQRLHRRDAGVVELLNDAEVLAHLLHLPAVLGQFRGQGFEGDFDSAHLILAAVNDAHAALAQLAQHAVAAQEQVAGLDAPGPGLAQGGGLPDTERLGTVVEGGQVANGIGFSRRTLRQRRAAPGTEQCASGGSGLAFGTVHGLRQIL